MPTRRFAIASLITALLPRRRRSAAPAAKAATCPEEPPTGSLDGPPRAVLRASSGACQVAGRLGFCWSCNGGSVCSAGGGGAPSGPIVLATDETAEIRLAHLGHVDRALIRV